jgi:hypothetical protein
MPSFFTISSLIKILVGGYDLKTRGSIEERKRNHLVYSKIFLFKPKNGVISIKKEFYSSKTTGIIHPKWSVQKDIRRKRNEGYE